MAKITVEYGLNKIKLGFIIANIIMILLFVRAGIVVSQNPDSITVNGIIVQDIK